MQKPPAMDPPIPESSPPAPPARPPRAPTRCYERWTKKKRINNTLSQQGRQEDLKVACYQFHNCYFINWKNVNYQQDHRGHLQYLLWGKLDCDHFKKCYSKRLTISKTTKGTYNMSWKNSIVTTFKIVISSCKTFNTSTISKTAKGTSWSNEIILIFVNLKIVISLCQTISKTAMEPLEVLKERDCHQF